MKSNPSKQLLACLALLSLALFGANRSFAENEPTDDSLGGATPINLGTNGSQVIETGRISNSASAIPTMTTTRSLQGVTRPSS